MPLRGIVFDFDGVIANSEPLHYRAFRDVLADLGVALSEDDYYRKYLGFDDAGVFEAIRRTIREDGRNEIRSTDVGELVRRKARRFEAIEHEGPTLFPGAREAVVRAADMAPVAIASGARRDEIQRVIDREGLAGHFTTIVAAEDSTRSKPAPDPYLRAVALIGSATACKVSPDSCVAFEDSIWGLESAASAGLRTVGVAHTYPLSSLAVADLTVESLLLVDWDAVAQLFT